MSRQPLVRHGVPIAVVLTAALVAARRSVIAAFVRITHTYVHAETSHSSAKEVR